jgi:hypothetical protein
VVVILFPVRRAGLLVCRTHPGFSRGVGDRAPRTPHVFLPPMAAQ